MARRRDARTFGHGPYILGMERDEARWGSVAPVLSSTKPWNGSFLPTHSPVILACPESRIDELGGNGVAERRYDAVEAVGLTRPFPEAPERLLRAALEESV